MNKWEKKTKYHIDGKMVDRKEADKPIGLFRECRFTIERKPILKSEYMITITMNDNTMAFGYYDKFIAIKDIVIAYKRMWNDGNITSPYFNLSKDAQESFKNSFWAEMDISYNEDHARTELINADSSKHYHKGLIKFDRCNKVVGYKFIS